VAAIIKCAILVQFTMAKNTASLVVKDSLRQTVNVNKNATKALSPINQPEFAKSVTQLVQLASDFMSNNVCPVLMAAKY
jgi:hypothetical protein